ncbi:MAG TPA: (Fe-S)-binding protein [Xanthomonadaceae bacterium]|nr:(Fe-S)-binding protein [Xanthomonadaceae bacterium]
MFEAALIPAAGSLVALADQCVQCGLCLPVCPTYALERIEAESPRGRIALARGWALDALPTTAVGDRHLDQCLACRRCEAVCPAGVQYGPLLVQARAQQRERRAAGLAQRAMEWFCARPTPLSALLSLYRLLYPVLPARMRPLPRPPRIRAAAAASSGTDDTIVLFTGCIADAYESDARVAVSRLGTAIGRSITALPAACCGALHAHGGAIDSTEGLAGRLRALVSPGSTVLVQATGCFESVATALPGCDVQDAMAFFARYASRLEFMSTTERIALHVPCSQASVVRSDGALRALLARVPGLDVVDLQSAPGATGCCGAAGNHMLIDPPRAAAHRRPLLAAAHAAGVSRILSANIGCRLHLGNATALPVQHPLEFLAERLDPAAILPPSPALN